MWPFSRRTYPCHGCKERFVADALYEVEMIGRDKDGRVTGRQTLDYCKPCADKLADALLKVPGCVETTKPLRADVHVTLREDDPDA